ncbi:MAG: NADH-quinone oxidoreductase subunit NuoN [Demequinaceae bacterium]|nr:NADH-quinone oxidoreductase subunit NuoN [Demequinaceae bacterium]
MTFESPIIEWAPLAPVLIVFAAAVIGILIETVAPPVWVRRPLQVALALVATITAAATAALQWIVLDGDGTEVVQDRIICDRQSLIWMVMIAVFAALALLLFTSRAGGDDAFTPLAAATPGSKEEREASRKGFAQTEVFPLALFSAGGMMLFTMVSDTLILFVVLELFSLPHYVLVALARRHRLLSQEAALKYFLMGAFASAIYLFGAALVYGGASSTSFTIIDSIIALARGREALILVGVVLMLVGLLFKLGAVPFHAWTPDAYQGAPTPVTAFMAAATKAAAAAALLRFLYLAVHRFEWELAPVLWTIAIATMLVGTVAAIVQTDIKRMLAYSSIAHGGFVLVAVTSFEREALAAVPFYMLAYGLATLGAFAIVGQVREVTKDGSLGAEATRLGQWAGLGRRSPWLATAMAIFLLSFAGIPLTAGFIGKFVVFKAAVVAGGWPLVVVAVLASVVAVFFYVRVVVLMFLTPVPEDLEDAVEVTESTGPFLVVGITALATVVLGVVPSVVLDLASNAAILVP